MFLKIRNWFIDTKIGFKNLFYWLPIIWNDRGWDRYFVFNILNHKVKEMIKYYGYDKQFIEPKENNIHEELYKIRDVLHGIIWYDYNKDAQEILFQKSLSFGDMCALSFGDMCALSKKDSEKLYQLKQKLEKNDYDKLFKLLNNYYKNLV